jgi:hypothetical protein
MVKFFKIENSLNIELLKGIDQKYDATGELLITIKYNYINYLV